MNFKFLRKYAVTKDVIPTCNALNVKIVEFQIMVVSNVKYMCMCS